jgi:hypothetical protein
MLKPVMRGRSLATFDDDLSDDELLPLHTLCFLALHTLESVLYGQETCNSVDIEARH